MASGRVWGARSSAISERNTTRVYFTHYWRGKFSVWSRKRDGDPAERKLLLWGNILIRCCMKWFPMSVVHADFILMCCYKIRCRVPRKKGASNTQRKLARADNVFCIPFCSGTEWQECHRFYFSFEKGSLRRMDHRTRSLNFRRTIFVPGEGPKN